MYPYLTVITQKYTMRLYSITVVIPAAYLTTTSGIQSDYFLSCRNIALLQIVTQTESKM